MRGTCSSGTTSYRDSTGSTTPGPGEGNPCSSSFYNLFFFRFTAHRGLGFLFFNILFYTVLQCDLTPLRPHCGEAPRPGTRLEPGTGDLEAGTLTSRPRWSSFHNLYSSLCALRINFIQCCGSTLYGTGNNPNPT